MWRKILIIFAVIFLIAAVAGSSSPDAGATEPMWAVIYFGGRLQTVEVKNWLSGSNGAVEIICEDGSAYKTHWNNVLITNQNPSKSTDGFWKFFH